jgi:ElaB/YqjD/DUF883 family membrane-anchored ribosome-binding protein
MTHSYLSDTDPLIADLKAVIHDTEELLKMTADHVGDNAQEVRDRVSKRLHQAVSELQHLQTVAVAQVKAAGHATDEFVHENPWKSIGIASGLGLIVGLLIARR